MTKRIIRLGFDARLAGSAHAGIGRYSEELLRELLALTSSDSDGKYFWLIFVAKKDQLPWLKNYPNVQVELLPIRHYTLREQIFVLKAFNQANLDLLHVPHFNVPIGYRRPFIVTIHDLLWHTQQDPHATTLPAWQYRLKYGAYRFVSQMAMRRAKAILVPTKFVEQEVAKYVSNPQKIIVTSEGVSQAFLDTPDVGQGNGQRKRASKTKERAPYFVYTGSLYPHKNIEVVLKALQKLPNVNLKVLTARSIFLTEFWEKVRLHKIADQIEVQNGLSDEEVIKLYQQSSGLIQPSLSEGFGLTGIEAMAVGCPVIASDIPVLREVYGQQAEYFDPQQADELVKLLKKFINQPASAEELQARQKYARQYTWHSAAIKTWQVYLNSIANL